MKIDKDTGAPQFTYADLAAAGLPKGKGTCLVTTDDLNLFLRQFAWEQKTASKTERRVWQWRYKTARGKWKVSQFLYSEAEVAELWTWDGAEYEKHSGPFDIGG